MAAADKLHVLILSATGMLGSHVLRLLLNAGHEVSVLVRDASRLPAAAEQQA